MEAQIPHGKGQFCGTYFGIKIKMPFWVWIHGSPENCVLYGGTDTPWERAVWWDIFLHQDQDAILGVDSWEPRKLCVIWRCRSPMGWGSFVGHISACPATVFVTSLFSPPTFHILS